ncbi:unnamed protein product [Candidula unifasciata]|uniref:Ig-like domain-containing protein n=1 Tax=Candidula unifasciata TaxID=100452 RepID=A0A8S3YML5_9EUPU|nr:unnamed protein product [Candidula unifasciata]
MVSVYLPCILTRCFRHITACCMFLLAQYFRKPPNIIEPNSPKTLYFSSNSNVEIKCRAEGVPTPTYKWTRNGNPITVDNLVQYDSSSGSLKIPDFTKREEGTYMCIASNVFDNEGGRVTAASFAPPVKIFQTRVEKFIDAPETRQQVTEYNYAVLPCANKGEVVGSDINTNWYESEKSKDVSMDSGRLFIDQEGNLHFSFARISDATVGFIYLCGISSTSDKLIRLGNANILSVIPVQNPTAIKPQLQYSNSGVKALKFSKARLECVFSGYDPNPPHVPVIQWFEDTGKEISSSTDKFTLSEDRRALTINNLQEEDERNYYCMASNSAGNSGKMAVFLDVTSAPIFHNNGAPKDQTVVENVDVTFNCDARSASNEEPPNSPVWYINGVKTGQHTDPTKFQLSNGNKTLTVMKVKKATDILCVQCEVTNHVDTTWADSCLTVILPIRIEKRPPEEQEIDHGDTLDFTIVATTDPAMSLNYRWEFKNVTYSGSESPPFMVYDPTTLLAYINTSLLTEEQYETLEGTYRRTIYHSFETVYVDTVVTLKHKPGMAFCRTEPSLYSAGNIAYTCHYFFEI